MAKMKKIGIMGGTFNPIHFAHLILAENALQQCILDEIMFLPSGYPAYKEQNEIAPDVDRLAMVQAAIKGNSSFYVSTLELERKGPTYTIDTIEELHQKNKADYYFILGGDSLFQIEQWKECEKVMKLCHLVAAVRQQDGIFALEKRAEELRKKYGAKITLLNTPYLDISSSMLRKRISLGHSIRYLLPEAVLSYIKEHKLYQK